MACLLNVAKWLRTSVCDGPHNMPAYPEVSQLNMLFLNPSILRGMVGLITIRMSEISSLLEVRDMGGDGRHQFPVGH
jgi:hypothetical protein